MYLLSLITVILSLIFITSFNLWDMKIIDFPDFFRLSKISNSFSVSWGVRTAVGSSKIRISAPLYRVFIISTLWASPTDISFIFLFIWISKLYFFTYSRTFVLALLKSTMTIDCLGSKPRIMFSRTVISFTNINSWWTIPIPRFIASFVV